ALASNFPVSMRVPARFGETETRSRFVAAKPRHSHAPAPRIAAVRIQCRRSRTYAESRRSAVTRMQIPGDRRQEFTSVPERGIPPAKQTTGQSEGSFMCAVSVAPTPPYDMFVGKCQTN